jgi:hypothetical protein
MTQQLKMNASYSIESIDDEWVITKNGKAITQYKNKNGYITVNLDRKKTYLHRIVALQFIPNPDNLPEVNHIDYDRSNNKIENLQWVTARQNSQDKGFMNGKPLVILSVEEFWETYPDAIQVTEHYIHQYNNLYVDPFTKHFFYFLSHNQQFRKINVSLGNRGTYIHANDVNGVRRSLGINSLLSRIQK